MRQWSPLAMALGCAMRDLRKAAGYTQSATIALSTWIDPSHYDTIECGNRLLCEDHALSWCLALGSGVVSYDKLSRLLVAIRAIEHVRRRGEDERAYIAKLARVDIGLADLLVRLGPILDLKPRKGKGENARMIRETGAPELVGKYVAVALALKRAA